MKRFPERFSVGFGIVLYARLCNLAVREGRSRESMVRVLVNEALNARESRAPASVNHGDRRESGADA
ncbi:hypothetical protein DSI31_00935 [Mycobacterium tuberculosis]|uniref:hypothetical protein n=1 Tax=Mycobacterium tuberculosis TaxID=1773 RepID=UPI000E28AE16|nr:hypothetical protein [Mycobacterium tuberculosis]REM10458.1 hypothetical protein DSI34_13400 [Mycobacterium tuberculosis]REM41465.1 hypothetical protein DSI31_00935 [Mycobacterium tuberculosis]REM68351.1 hypothetical protein DSI38_06345 [Mycobacterium tuberculosis]REN15709.1 hypothetical protein DSI41_15720 [Mycobacterium tuberculosis]REP62986.1 hypothetical protein DSJ19_07480 [Mycobacterium tuberculosis]